jgi:glucose/arabinose dehydrogenase
MHPRGIFLCAALCAAAVVLFQAAQNPQLPPPYATKSVTNGPRVVPPPEGSRLSIPPGFHVEVWAEDFNVPRFMMLGPSNEILLSDSGPAPRGCVYVFQGKDRKKIIDGLNQPYGLAMLNGYLYVAENDSVKRYKYDAKAMTAT